MRESKDDQCVTPVVADDPQGCVEVEAAYEVWHGLGEPAHHRFGLTVTPDGRHCVWFDSPDDPHTWELPTG